MVDPKMVRLCLCASLFQKNNNNSKNGLITIVKYYLYIYIYLEAYLNARLNSEYIFFLFFTWEVCRIYYFRECLFQP